MTDENAEARVRLVEVNEFVNNTRWVCLGPECPRSCCSNEFAWPDLSPLYPDEKERIRVQDLCLLPHEKNTIIRNCGSGSVHMEENGGPYKLTLAKEGSCRHWIGGLCALGDIRPSICRAYPIIPAYDPRFGFKLAVDALCPGFEKGERDGVYLAPETALSMIAAAMVVANRYQQAIQVRYNIALRSLTEQRERALRQARAL